MALIKEEISKLIDLQELDCQILKFKKIIEEKPLDIAKLEEQFEVKKAGLKDLEEQAKQIIVKRKTKENELASKEENIKKLQNQLYAIKTNKEYQAMLSEIANHKSDCSLIEEEILKNFDESDKIATLINKEKQFLAEQEKVLNVEKAKVNNEIADAKAQLNNFQGKRDTVIPGIDKKLLGKYDRILESRGGLAVAEVKQGACQGCFMNMPPQVINEIKLGESIVVCEMCNRILYINPDSE